MSSIKTHLADFNGCSIEIVDHNGQPWITAEQVGIALGIKHARRAANKIYARHQDEFENGIDTCITKLVTQGDTQNRDTRIFSQTGCILLAFFAQTERAVEFRRWAKQVLVKPQPTQQAIALPNPTVKSLATTIGQLKDENTALKDELLEIQRYKISILEGPQTPKREAPRPLSGTEKSHILKLKQAGKGTTQIAQTIGRSRSAVRSVIREGEPS